VERQLLNLTRTDSIAQFRIRRVDYVCTGGDRHTLADVTGFEYGIERVIPADINLHVIGGETAVTGGRDRHGIGAGLELRQGERAIVTGGDSALFPGFVVLNHNGRAGNRA